jgi:predicted esterase YcpF (UPF0227 family)
LDGAGSPAVLYLHGFRSSPESFKACRMRAWLAEHRPDVVWRCPQLPPSPREAVDMLNELIGARPELDWRVVGSSLGGFYATVLGEAWSERRPDMKVAVINPAVNPDQDLSRYIGELTNWNEPDVRFHFKAEFVQELRDLRPLRLSGFSRYFAIIATGDEVLNAQDMQDRYAGATVRLVQGSDHALSDFDAHLPALLAFLGLDAVAPTGT